MPTTLDIAQLRLDGGTQPRSGLSGDRIAQLMADITAGDEMRPVVACWDGADHWLADGFHRVEAYRKLGRAKIEVIVERGTARDAFLRAIKLNESTPLTLAEKKACAERMLRDPEWSQLPYREIARRCGLGSHNTVAEIHRNLSGQNDQMQQPTKTKEETDVRNEQSAAGATVHSLEEHREKKSAPAAKQPEPTKRKVTRSGKTYEMDTSTMSESAKKRKGAPPRLSTKAWATLKSTHIADDENQKRQLARLKPKMQIQVARLIKDGDAESVADAKEKIAAGAPIDDWGRAYQAVMSLPPDDRLRLCRIVEKETTEEAAV